MCGRGTGCSMWLPPLPPPLLPHGPPPHIAWHISCRRPLQAAASGQRTKKVFVGGLAATVDEEALRGYFEEYGTVSMGWVWGWRWGPGR